MYAHHIRRYGPALVFGPGLVIATVLISTLGCPSSRTPRTQSPKGALITIPADAPTNDSPCEDRLSFARETMDDLVQAANGSCTTDAQCTTVYAETQCFGACQAPILRSRLDAFREDQTKIEQRACVDYMQDGCAYSGPRCMATEAVCEQGRCALRQAAG